MTSMRVRDTMKRMKTAATTHLPAGNMLTWNRSSKIQSKKRVQSKVACRKASVRQELRRGE